METVHKIMKNVCMTCDHTFPTHGSCVRCPKCGESTLKSRHLKNPTEKLMDEADRLAEKGYGSYA